MLSCDVIRTIVKLRPTGSLDKLSRKFTFFQALIISLMQASTLHNGGKQGINQ